MNIAEELSLRDFFTVIKRRRRECLLIWGTVFGGTCIYTATVTPVYKAQAILHAQAPDESSSPADLGPLSVLAGPAPSFNLDQLSTNQLLEVALRRMNKIRPDASPHEVDDLVQQFQNRLGVEFSDKEHQMIAVTLEASTGKAAAAELNELAQVMVEQVTEDTTAKAHRTKMFIESQLQETEGHLHESEDRLKHSQEKFGPESAGTYLVGRLMELKNKRTELAQKYTDSYPEMRSVNAEIRSLESQLQQVPKQEVDIARISREMRLQEDLYSMLTKRLEEARIVESARVAPLTIVEPATEPAMPDRPNKRYNLTAGFIIGFVLALALVLGREHLDTSMVTTEEIEAYLQLPVLATIPHIERRHKPEDQPPGGIMRKRDRLGEARSRLVFNFSPQSAFVEVYHILRNNLMKGVQTQESQVYLFTSSVVAEGKSLTAANFALAAAQAGIPTLLAETDLRKPMVNKLFDIPQEPGLMNYFYTSPRWESYMCGWEDIKKKSATASRAINEGGLNNLHVLPAGASPANPMSILSSERFAQLVKDMRRRFPLVVLDGAPAVLFADSAIIGRYVDGVVFVYRFGRTPREVLSRAHNQLASSKAKLLGVVVNDIATGSSQDNNYYSMYSDYENEHAKPKVSQNG